MDSDAGNSRFALVGAISVSETVGITSFAETVKELQKF